MDNLNEASVWDPKYPTGYKFSFSSSIAKGSKNKLDIINNASKFKYGSNDVFTKADITDTALDINFGGNPGIPYYIKSERTKEVLRIQGAGSGSIFIKMSGSKRVLPPGITATAFLETFAVLSIMGVSNYEEALRYKNKELMIDLSKFEGINTTLKEEINDILKNTSKLGSPKSFIHKSIDDYYDALKAYETDVKQLKTNTSDAVVIYEGTYSDVMKALKEGWAISDDPAKEGMIIFGDTNGTTVKFKQVSLKAGKEGARLGRITSIMKNLTDMNESYGTHDFGLPTITLNEGFRGFINKAINLGKMSISKFNQVRKSVFEFLSRLVAIFKPSAFKRTLDKETSIYLRKNKDVKAYLDGALNESPEKIKLTEGVLNRINKKIDILESVVNTGSDSTKLITLHTKLASNIKTDTSTKFMNLLICNEISLECLTRLVPIIKAKGAPEHVSQIIDVMRRGSTALPVVIAYSDGSPVEILQGVDPVSPRAAQESVIITVHPSSNTHYVINIYYLVELNKNLDDSVFVKVQMTNAGGDTAISWKVEGNTMMTYKKIQESI